MNWDCFFLFRRVFVWKTVAQFLLPSEREAFYTVFKLPEQKIIWTKDDGLSLFIRQQETEDGIEHGLRIIYLNNGGIGRVTELRDGKKHGGQWDFEPNDDFVREASIWRRGKKQRCLMLDVDVHCDAWFERRRRGKGRDQQMRYKKLPQKIAKHYRLVDAEGGPGTYYMNFAIPDSFPQ